MNKINREWNLFYPFVPAVFAGMFIALGAYGSQIVFNSSNRILSAFIFPIGLILVILTNSELFTGNCTLFVPLFKKEIQLPRLVTHGIIVYIGNFIGSFLVAYAIHQAGLIPPVANEIAAAKIDPSFLQLLIRGVFCNILVCAAVYLSSRANTTTGKIMSIFLPVALFVLCGFEHSIANMYFLPIGGQMVLILNNLIPVTIGNIIGGLIFSWYIYEKEVN